MSSVLETVRSLLDIPNISCLAPNNRENTVANRLFPLDSDLSRFDSVEEDNFSLEQTKMLENLVKIVDFILK